MLLSTLLLRESTNLLQWLGGGCVIAGMLLIGLRKRRAEDV